MMEDGETVGVVLAGRDPDGTGEPPLDELAAGLKARRWAGRGAISACRMPG